MCTDEQWLRKAPQHAVMTSKLWKWPSQGVSVFHRKQDSSFWLSPLSVPQGETSWFMQFPSFSSACTTHMPCKLK